MRSVTTEKTKDQYDPTQRTHGSINNCDSIYLYFGARHPLDQRAVRYEKNAYSICVLLRNFFCTLLLL